MWSLTLNLTTPIQGYSPKDKPIPIDSLRWTYMREYKRGWRIKIDSSQGRGESGPILRRVWRSFDRVQVQKRSTCTTTNFGYDSYRKEFYMSFYINAFPKYPLGAKAGEGAEGGCELSWITPSGDMRRAITQGFTGGTGYGYGSLPYGTEY